ncbi:hypothetical protein C943_00822 [Mariniradius saccharolyticus AK6]|uniref:Uncharacterized protein n=1 Tax=Mariniradius saccharolyticus AK6 TaxID=1239962 RepID=M7Y6F7_9BACT|nr:hypothetical protein C943_00822 [Mariniradius saccharolyticus AK6]
MKLVKPNEKKKFDGAFERLCLQACLTSLQLESQFFAFGRNTIEVGRPKTHFFLN